jgi:hypothetical protein
MILKFIFSSARHAKKNLVYVQTIKRIKKEVIIIRSRVLICSRCRSVYFSECIRGIVRGKVRLCDKCKKELNFNKKDRFIY